MGLNNDKKCDKCGGPRRVDFGNSKLPYYQCNNCNKGFCNPCASIAGRTAGYSAACPYCHADLRSTRVWE